MDASKIMLLTFFSVTFLIYFNRSANATSQSLFPAILIFGDSTSDTGNNNYYLPALFKATHLPYGIDLPDHKTNGRFSNGKLISDIIASNLKIKEFVPPFLQPNISDQEIITGVCFASAGSGYDERTSLSTRAIPVSHQSSMFKNYIARLKRIVGTKKAMEIIKNALVVVNAGPNDFIFNFYKIPTRRLKYPDIYSYQEFVLKKLDGFVRELYSLGCRNIMVGGLAPMGCIPVQMNSIMRKNLGICVEQENKDSVMYNQKLQKNLLEIEASLPGSKFLYGNSYDPMMDMIQNPSKYGFKETKKGCCESRYLKTSSMCNARSKICSNHSDHLFWDSIHPSEAAYSYIGNFVDAQIRDWIKA